MAAISGAFPVLWCSEKMVSVWLQFLVLWCSEKMVWSAPTFLRGGQLVVAVKAGRCIPPTKPAPPVTRDQTVREEIQKKEKNIMTSRWKEKISLPPLVTGRKFE